MPRYPLSGRIGQHRALVARNSLLTNRRDPPNPYLSATWSLKPQHPSGRDFKRQKSSPSNTGSPSSSSSSSSLSMTSSRATRGRSLCTVLPLSPEAPAKLARPGVLFHTLPDDIIASVCFSGYFDTVFVHTCVMLVCKRMRQVAESSNGTLDLRGLYLSSRHLSQLLTVYRNIDTLDLRFCKLMDDSAIKNLVPLHSTLTRLNLRGCPVTDRGLEAIANLTRLRELDLSRSSAVGRPADEDTPALAGIHALKPLRELRTIGLAWNKQITDMAIVTLCSSVRGIVSLNLQCCMSLSDVACKVLSEQPLERLDLTGCTFLSDVGIQHICRVPTLTWLSLAHCYYLTDDSVDALLSGLTRLQDLDMRDCALISPSARERLVRRHPKANVTIS